MIRVVRALPDLQRMKPGWDSLCGMVPNLSAIFLFGCPNTACKARNRGGGGDGDR
jgi:hypothetical protein